MSKSRINEIFQAQLEDNYAIIISSYNFFLRVCNQMYIVLLEAQITFI